MLRMPPLLDAFRTVEWADLRMKMEEMGALKK